MSIVTQELDYCKLKINYTAELSDVQKKQTDALSYFKDRKVPGFRKGKASADVLKSKFKNEIKQIVQNDLLNQAHDDILFETKIRPIGKPQIDNVFFDGAKFEAEFTYWNKPSFELKDCKGIEVIAPHIEGNVQDASALMIEELRKNQGTVAPYSDSDFVQMGDKITLSYKLSNGTEEQGQLYDVGNSLFKGFDENIVGMNLDEERVFKIEVDGQVVDCTVTLHMGMKKTPAALDDLLAQKYGLQTFEELTKTVETISSNQLKQQKDGKVAEQIVAKIVAMHDFKVPEWLFLMEARQLAHQQGMKWEELSEDVKKSFETKACDNVKLTLILDSIQQEVPESKVSDEEAINGIKNVFSSRGMDPEATIQSYIKNNQLFQIVAKYKNDYTMQWLVDNAKIIEG